jgi:hypothetical protein
MVSVERFTDHMDDELVYVRHVPPGITGVRNERRGQ